jgi:hypothetical protein
MSGLRIIHHDHTVDVPPEIEAEGGAAVKQYVAEQLGTVVPAPVADVAPNPPSEAEGAES